jgi:asparagine synthase (glutamine-hydrolysing)
VCGICGLVAREGERPDAIALRAMNATLRHRGPDSDGELLDGPVGLAMRRLAIIDLPGGDQPISNEDATIHVVCNGEIVNHAELRTGLLARGHRFKTRSDTEVLVHLYEERGDAFADSLRGMFAIALWDARRRRVVLARDRFGIKPLFYSEAGGVLRFASELRALSAAPGFPAEIGLDALEAYLAFNSIPAPLTAYRAARKLPPGCLLVAERGSVAVRRYARPAPPHADAAAHGDDSALAAELLVLLRDSVRAHLVADVPVGVLLSGGIDSGVLTALAAQEGGPPATFTVGFGERSFDELDHARLVARRHGTDHHEMRIEPDAALLLPELADAFDEPLGDSSALATFLVSRLAAEHVKVVLSGEGADELFGGYHTYVADLLGDHLGWAGPLLRPMSAMAPSSSRRVSLDYRLRRFSGGLGRPALERHHAWKEIFSADARAALLDGRRGADPLVAWERRFAETAGSEPLVRLQDVDLGLYLVDDLLVKTDRASMRHSLEARVPFLDAAVADFALGLPRDARVRLGWRGAEKKRLLRRVAAGLLPPEIVRGPKRGFSIPAAAWLRGPLEPFAREVLSPQALRRHGLFEPQAVEAVIDRHVARREDCSRQIWGLMAWVLWQDRQRTGASRELACASG